LKKIWDDQFCIQCIVDNVPGWECLWCGKKFIPVITQEKIKI
jgi:hypothetical protein